MTQSAQAVIKGIERSITQRDLEQVQAAIGILPLAELPQKTFDGLFVRFIGIAYQFQCTDIALYLLDTWEKVNDDDEMPYETYLFYLVDLDGPILQWIMTLIGETTSGELHLDNLIHFDPSDITVRAAQRVVDTYGLAVFQPDRVQQLIEMARQETNGLMERFFTDLKAKVMEPLSKPDWVRNVNDMDSLPTESDLLDEADEISDKLKSTKVHILPVEDAVELLTAGLPREGLTREEMEYSVDVIRSFYNGLTNAQKIALLANGEHAKDLYYLSQDKKMFSYLGPTNIIYDTDLNADHVCCKYGGDRMLLCRCFERYGYDEENQDVPDESDDLDWFIGYCQQCGNKIKYRWYALRLPLVHGGWNGCYCSFSCLEQQSDNAIMDQLISLMKANINIIGIQDRLEE